jgi:hypothetical protein
VEEDKEKQLALLIAELIVRLGTSDFVYTVDEVEWTDPKYSHQN